MSYNQRHHQEAEPDLVCNVCSEQKLSSSKFRLQNGRRAARNICRDCSAEFIEAQVDYGAINIKCPIFYCDDMLDPISCRPIVTVRALHRWLDNFFPLQTTSGFEDRCCGGAARGEVADLEPCCSRISCRDLQCISETKGIKSDNSDIRTTVFRGPSLRRGRRCPECGRLVKPELNSGCSV